MPDFISFAIGDNVTYTRWGSIEETHGIISDFEGHFVFGKWYNEAGQLVQTDKNNLGISLKSGIYFYEISINHNGILKIIKGKMLQP
jgi:hypothetical protein